MGRPELGAARLFGRLGTVTGLSTCAVRSLAGTARLYPLVFRVCRVAHELCWAAASAAGAPMRAVTDAPACTARAEGRADAFFDRQYWEAGLASTAAPPPPPPPPPPRVQPV